MSILTAIEGFVAKEEHAIAGEIGKLSGVAKVALHTGTAVVSELNSIVQGPAGDVIGALTGTLGETVVEDLKKILPQVAAEFGIVDAAVDSADPNAILQEVVTVLQSKVGVAKNLDLHGLAILISTDISKGSLTWSDAAGLVEWYYKNAFTPVSAAAAA